MNMNEISKLSEEEAREYFERIRWPDGPVCPHCGSVEDLTKLEGEAHRVGVYKCNACGKQFTSTVGTLLEDSHLPIRTWLMAFAILCSAKKGVSALQLQRQLGLGSYRTAWHLCHRIRHAMANEPMKGLLTGIIEVDETYVGGKPRKGSGPNVRGRGTKKTAVMALVERNGRVRAGPIERVDGKTLKTVIRGNVDKSSTIMTDEFSAYRGIGSSFEGGHQMVAHSRGEFSRDGINVNSAEAYFALLKRGVTGSFHHVSKDHLHRYCEEFSYRWNHRKESDSERTENAIKLVDGCRLKYKAPLEKP
jgi:transposase-like protein